MTILLMLGSGPNVVAATSWPREPFDKVVAINNAWRVRPDWDYLVHPEDLPADRLPPDVQPHQSIITAVDYVPAQNALGGFVYAGGTMAFTASYWALHRLRPRVIGYLGCDMVYPATGQTHFYGQGTADPLRPDISLRWLEAKSARLLLIAAAQGCALVNLSQDPSRLVFPRATAVDVGIAVPMAAPAIAAALRAEADLGYMVPSGRYWLEEDSFDPAEIDRIDALWLVALDESLRSAPLGETAP